MPGTLFIVATPIGNLEDLTFRALRILREVDVIAAEDTRRTAKLLAHYEIRKPLVSLHEHNEFREAPRLIERLKAGVSVALVSDAGTPAVADPGARLIGSAREQGVRVVPIPGANAIATALSASGFDASHFVFRGFPPPKGQARQSWLDAVSHDPVTQVVFEAPHRIRKTLAELESILVKRKIYVFRELTKINEESGIYPNICDSAWPKDVGEFTLVVSPSQDDRGLVKNRPFDHAAILALFEVLSSSGILSTEAAAELVALKFKTTSSNVLKAVKKAAILAKQQSKPLP